MICTGRGIGVGDVCAPWNLSCKAQEAAESITNTIFEEMASSVAKAVQGVVENLATLWINVNTPKLAGGSSTQDVAERGGTAAVYKALGHVTSVGFVLAGASVVILGMMVATKVRRGEGITAVGRAGVILAGVVLISGASSIAAAVIVHDPNDRTTSWHGPSGFIQGSTVWIVAALVVFSIIVGGAKMAWEQRAEPGRELLKSLVTMVIVSTFALTVVQLLVDASDKFSENIIGASKANEGEGLGHALVSLFVDPANKVILGFGTIPIAAIIFGIVLLVVSFIQLILMVARYAMLVVLAGILPLSASFSNTEMGRSWLRKNVSWLLAFILYKPAAAIIYATAIVLTQDNAFGDNGTGMLNVLAGLMLMIMAIIALPALMRFVTPAVAAVGGAAGGMAAGAMATGALEGGRLAGSRGNSGPQGAQGTQGPPGAAGTAGASGSSMGAATAGAGAGAAGVMAGAGAGGGGAAAGTAGTAGAAAAAGAPTAGVGAAAVVAGAAVAGAAKAGVDAAVGATVSTAEGSNAHG